MSLVEDTIVAIATPLGRGGVAVVRVSGPLAVDLINLHIDKAVARHCYYLKLRNSEHNLDCDYTSHNISFATLNIQAKDG